MRANINIHNMDCMVAMKDMKDNQFDLAIVDPPYNVGASDGKFGGKKGSSANVRGYNKNYTNHNQTPDKGYFIELFRVSKNQIIWGMNYYPENLKHSGAIIWDKLTTGPLSDCEIAFQSYNKLVTKYTHEWCGFKKGGDDKRYGVRIHPNQKPVMLYKWILENYAKAGNKIIDTHLGSGSTAIACWDLGFDLEAYEIDKEYYNKACKRFNRHCQQLQLF